ncbi:Flavohemoprotein (Hemoglobin-like protein) (Flavohemoglobin) (Nitric oxide dioxygenase) [Candidatus Burkholderia verschuerenii]|uniref:Flavohemoprotein (Hemoglobin-like protein) (Flavohemoglobin) (Nitric oxide dioxygenase) n=1 Tax=Candidatus Burkholderia verschuerenii TaxID=242163 RepID=A0A0L0MHE6_9BURK|nr:pyridoxamine 5'-phosphate oxidase family protein [Candidatus Burkholderia verschuerenii]KND61715.1 Flavohemoprotein (Hemoglobin-like protein) (Flavohemoglobin) (Nitric oxide dioxygenase) [Candidatus Burkholderia verschuerenii]
MNARVPSLPAGIAQSTWHRGEIALQKSIGADARMSEVGKRVVRDYMPEQHRQFFAQLPFAVFGSVDADGNAWATMLAGQPGFMRTPDAVTLDIAVKRDPLDPADAGMHDGASIGMLGIELHTRRRNRMNGVLQRRDGDAFRVAVEQSFGNCPQYIQLRDFAFVRDPAEPSTAQPIVADALTPRTRAMIERADTFFVASYFDREDGHRQVDVSHRGGRAGFVRVADDGSFTVPDFAGNSFFNTLGNIHVNGRAGLLFADFETGDMLQLAGDADVLLDSPETAAFQGAERLWRFTPRRIVLREAALPLRWTFRDAGWSPNSLMTGDWHATAERLKAAKLANAWRPFRVSRIVDESDAIRSFWLEPADGAGIVPHEAGQHLPIRVTLPGDAKPSLRTYTLSLAPSDDAVRISVKREGRVSSHLHDAVKTGDVIEARAPAGDFTIDAMERRPAVLLAAGVGITPMLAMLRHIVYESLRKRRVRPTWLIVSARTLASRAFSDEIDELVRRAGGAVTVVRVLSDPQGAEFKRDYDVSGRIDMDLLTSFLPFNDYDFYLCGPGAFMQALYDGLRKLNIADARVHAEAFGPASLVRLPDGGIEAKPLKPAATEAVVKFVKSGKDVPWKPENGTLLELAEAQDIPAEFSCRGGTCGTCRTRIVQGAVSYKSAPAFEVGEGEALICCAVPAAEGDGSTELKLEL